MALCDVLGVEPGGHVTISQVKMDQGRGGLAVLVLGTNKVHGNDYMYMYMYNHAVMG